MFVQYTDIVYSSMSYDRDAEWNELRVQELDEQIKKFKEDMRNLSSDYQTSGLCTENVNVFVQIVQVSSGMGNLSDYETSSMDAFFFVLFGKKMRKLRKLEWESASEFLTP